MFNSILYFVRQFVCGKRSYSFCRTTSHGWVVRRRAFILSTFLFPIVMILFIVGSVYLAVKSKEIIKIAVPNDSFLKSSLKSDTTSVLFVFDPTIDQSNFSEKGYNGFYDPTVTRRPTKTIRLFPANKLPLNQRMLSNIN